MLHIRRQDENETVTLHLSGTIDLATVLRLRDVAFSVIGERPGTLYLDLRAIAHVEITGINTLVTISRVARLVKVRCFILPSASLRDTLMQTGLTRMFLLPNDTLPSTAPCEDSNATPTANVPVESPAP
jgi:anti-anti-sigma factor